MARASINFDFYCNIFISISVSVFNVIRQDILSFKCTFSEAHNVPRHFPDFKMARVKRLRITRMGSVTPSLSACGKEGGNRERAPTGSGPAVHVRITQRLGFPFLPEALYPGL